MISYNNRFHSRNALRYIYKNGIANRSALITVKSIRNERRNSPRISVVVSKKILKSAVGRNRIRRRLYEIIRLDLPAIQPNADIVCIVTSPDVKTLPHDTLVSEIRELFSSSDLYKNKPGAAIIKGRIKVSEEL